MSVSTALLLQGALRGVFLIILVFVLIAAVVVLGAVSGGALGGRGSSGDEGATAAIVPPGRILAATGLGCACFGAYYGSVGFGFLGIILGAIAYYRGSRILGSVASILSFAAIFIGIYFGDQTAQFNL